MFEQEQLNLYSLYSLFYLHNIYLYCFNKLLIPRTPSGKMLNSFRLL